MSEIVDLKKNTIGKLQIRADHAIANMNDLPMFPYNLWMTCLKLLFSNWIQSLT